MSIRIGGVPYGVGAPLLAGLAEDPAVDLRIAAPSALVADLRAGSLDAALVSSVEAVRRRGYRALADLGIASRGEVRSVRAFRRGRQPIRSIGLDGGSETSVALLQVLLSGPLRAEVAAGARFERIEPTIRPDDLPHDLVLLIGDAGLRAEAGSRRVWDLGALWRDWTGLPMVFALWLLRPGADAGAIAPRLRRARQTAVQRGIADGTAGAAHYDLDARDLAGLRRFFAEVQNSGLAEAGAVPEFLSPVEEGMAP